MTLDKSKQYVFRIGSDNQHRILWNGRRWQYEFLAGGVIFDQLFFDHQSDMEHELSVHGLTLGQFYIDEAGHAETYSQDIQRKIQDLTEKGISPCSKHGLTAKNLDGSCEACDNPDYFDDFKGTEG